MYICKECGCTYTEDAVPTYQDFTQLGEKGFIDDCSCGGEIVEAYECVLCDELSANVMCDKCLNENITFETVLRYGNDTKQNIEINGYLAHEFTEEQINEILERELREAKKLGFKTKHEEYANNDLGHFEMWLEENKDDLWFVKIVQAIK